MNPNPFRDGGRGVELSVWKCRELQKEKDTSEEARSQE